MARGGADKTIKCPKAKMPKKCPECGRLNKYLLDKCCHCGTDLPPNPDVYRCPKCGEFAYVTEPGCPGCGAPIEELIAAGQVYRC